MNPFKAGDMETTRRDFATENGSKATLTAPRFDEKAEETARPVVPLGRVASSDGFARPRRGTRGLMLLLAVAVFVAAAVATIVYRSMRTTVPASVPQTSVEATTIHAVSEPAAEAIKAQPVRADVRPPSEAPNEADAKGDLSGGGEIERRERKAERSRERDEEKVAEHTRKEEKKQAKRERKEIERLAEQGSDSEKREESRPRLVDIYTVKTKP